MDYIEMPMENASPMQKSGKKQMKNLISSEFKGGNMGYGDMGLDLGNVMNLGLDTNFGSGNQEFLRGDIRHPSWGWEDYIERDFAAPRAFKTYGKESKADKRYRTVGPENEVLYGLESLGIAGGRAFDNSRKAGNLISKRVYEKRLRGAKKNMDKQRTNKYYKDTNRYESEPRQEQDNTGEAYRGYDESDIYDDYRQEEPYESNYERRGIRPELSESGGYGNYQTPQGQIVVAKKGKFSRKLTKYLGKRGRQHYFGSKVYEGYFPE